MVWFFIAVPHNLSRTIITTCRPPRPLPFCSWWLYVGIKEIVRRSVPWSPLGARYAGKLWFFLAWAQWSCNTRLTLPISNHCYHWYNEWNASHLLLSCLMLDLATPSSLPTLILPTLFLPSLPLPQFFSPSSLHRSLPSPSFRLSLALIPQSPSPSLDTSLHKHLLSHCQLVSALLPPPVYIYSRLISNSIKIHIDWYIV